MKRLLLLYLFFLLLSCGKGIFGPARVDGVVKDKTTNDLIPGATVYLLENDNSGSLLGPPGSSIIIDSTTTGAFGGFEFVYDKRNSYSYYVSGKKEHYIDNMLQVYILDLGAGNDVEVFLQPEAFLKVRVHKVNYYDEWDYIIVNDLYATFYGNYVDTIEELTVYGNQIQHLTWFIFNDGLNTNSQGADIYCPAFDTTYYEILY